MEILKFLLNYFMENNENMDSSPVFKLLKDNSFDLKRIINNFDLNMLLSLFKDFYDKQKPTEQKASVGVNSVLTPVLTVADKEIIDCLNNYLG